MQQGAGHRHVSMHAGRSGRRRGRSTAAAQVTMMDPAPPNLDTPPCTSRLEGMGGGEGQCTTGIEPLHKGSTCGARNAQVWRQWHRLTDAAGPWVLRPPGSCVHTMNTPAVGRCCPGCAGQSRVKGGCSLGACRTWHGGCQGGRTSSHAHAAVAYNARRAPPAFHALRARLVVTGTQQAQHGRTLWPAPMPPPLATTCTPLCRAAHQAALTAAPWPVRSRMLQGRAV